MPIVLLLARVYAFLMLDCAHVAGKSTGGNLARTMKIGLKAGKNCDGTLPNNTCVQVPHADTPVDAKEYLLAIKVLSRVSAYEGLLQKITDMSLEERQACERLVAEYYILRTSVVGKQSQILAELTSN